MKWLTRRNLPVLNMFLFLLLFLLLISLPVCAEESQPVTDDGEFAYEIINDEVYIRRYLGSSSVVTVPETIDGKPVVSVCFAYELSGSFIYNRTVKRVVLPPTVKRLDNYAFECFLALEHIDGLENVEYAGTCFAFLCPLDSLLFSANLKTIAYDAFNGVQTGKLIIPDDVEVYGEEDYPYRGLYQMKTGEIELCAGTGEKTLSLLDGMLFSADGKTLIHVPYNKASSYFVLPSGTERILRSAFPAVNMRFEVEIPASVSRIDDEAMSFGQRCVMFVYPDSCALAYARSMTAEAEAISYYIPFTYIVIGQDTYIPYEERRAALLASITNDSMDDYQKALAVHDWILENVEYYDIMSSDPEDVFISGKAVCEGYANLYSDLLNTLGIHNIITGNYAHAFNAVEIGGKWFFVDCTWDDNNSGSAAEHTFFGFGQSFKNHIYGGEASAIPYDLDNANEYQFHYWYRMSFLNALYENIRAEIFNCIQGGSTSFAIDINYDLLDSQVPIISVGTFFQGFNIVTTQNTTGWLLADMMNEQFTQNSPGYQCEFREPGQLLVKPSSPRFDYLYRVSNQGISITGYIGNDAVVEIPASIDGLPTREIAAGAFDSNTVIREVIFPEGLVEIGNQAFSECVNLVSVSFPSSLKTIGANAFGGTGLLEIYLPDGLTSVGSNAFGACYSLRSVRIPGSLLTLPDYMFGECTVLDHVAVPEGVTTIGKYCFYGCYALSDISLPSSVTVIDEYAFNVCVSLKSFTAPPNVETIKAGTFQSCDQMKTCYLPDGLLTVGSNAFGYCKSLTRISIPETVTTIGNNVFDSCTHLSEISLPDNLTVIPERAFFQCSSLKSIEIPDSVTVIGDYAFCYTGLEQVKLPDDLAEIGMGAFNGCRLNSISIPDGVSTIRAETFFGNFRLFKADIPASVTYIEDSAFQNCVVLTMVVEPESYAYSYAVEHGIPYRMSDVGLRILTLPSGLQVIESEAFAGTAADVIIIPASCESVADDAFDGCENLIYIKNNSYAVFRVPENVILVQ